MDELEQEKKPLKERKAKKTYRRGIFTGIIGTVLVLVCVVVVVAVLALNGVLGNNLMKFGSKLAFLTSIIEYYYYEDVEDETLETGVYKGLLESLGDPYSTYYTPEEYQELMIDTTGNYQGIGAVLTQRTDTGQVYVVKTYEGTPARDAGLETGDELVSADGVSAGDMELSEFIEHIRGESGTSVELVYSRNGEEHKVSVPRAEVVIPSVDSQMLTDSIGYVEILSFSSNTKEQYEQAMKDLKEQGMKAVVFDLRYNGGGLVSSVTEILDDILPEGTTVYMEDKNGKRTTYTSDEEKKEEMPIVVLTSENTASAAEIFAGAIRDFQYGTLIGTKTFGKGIVQNTIPLKDGSAVKVTIASYYTPSGECIHKLGIEPDIELEYTFLGTEDQAYDVTLDNQIQKAVEVLTEELK